MDGDGLRLKVTLNSKTGVLRRNWVLRIKVRGGALREFGLGSADSVGLAAARRKADDIRRDAEGGADPVLEKQIKIVEAAKEAASRMTFQECAEAYVAAHRSGWKNPKHAAQWSSTLATYVYPVFGPVPVADVDQRMVMRILDPIWATKTETASRVRGRIESILDWASVRGFRNGENPARWRGHLQKALPARSKINRVRHHAALPYDQIPEFFDRLTERMGAGADCLRFLILTASRYSEAAGATCGEVSLEKALWTVPAERMKAGRDHRVPLSEAALLLAKRRLDADSAMVAEALLFGSDFRQGAQLSDMTLSAVLKRMGHGDITVHGFRSTFRDWCAETTAYPGEVAEAALAHVVGDKVEAAYRRGDLFDKRRLLMDDWAVYCTSKCRR